jgi:hypothetical protein
MVQAISTKLTNFVPYVIVIKPVQNEVNTSIDSTSFGRLKINRQN